MPQDGKQSFKIGDVEVIFPPENGKPEPLKSDDKLIKILADMIADVLAYESKMGIPRDIAEAENTNDLESQTNSRSIPDSLQAEIYESE